MRSPSARVSASALILALCLAGGRAPALALTDEQIFREIRFQYAPPGARALGMGGAYLAVADDASAVRTNPGGLYFVAAPEFRIELRAGALDDPAVSRGSVGSLAVDPVTGARDLPFLGITSVSEIESSESVSFLSVAWPFDLGSSGRRMTLAGSRELVLSRTTTLRSTGERTLASFSFDSFPNTVGPGGVQAYTVNSPVTGGSDTEVVFWNVGVAVDVHGDFSVGLTLSYAILDLQADVTTEVIDPLGLFVDPSHPRLPAQQNSEVFQTSIDDTDSDIAFTLGVHWHPNSVFPGGVSPWGFGAIYYKGASFTVTERTTLNGLPDATFDNVVNLPDRWGVGASYRTPMHWLFSLEYQRVELSDLMEGFVSGVNYLTGTRLADGAFATDPSRSPEYAVDDGNLIRAGAEYSRKQGGTRGFAVRGGYYRTPDDRIRMTGFNSADPAVNAVYLEAFSGGEETDHFTAGFGYSFGRSGIDIAGEGSDQGYTVVGAYVYRWERGNR